MPDPIWGTPEPDVPATPPQDTPAWGSPDPVAPPTWPADEPRITPLLTTVLRVNNEVEVRENRDFLGSGNYEVLTSEGMRVATLTQQASASSLFFGDLASARFRLHDDTGVPAAELVRAGSLGTTMAFELIDATGRQLAVIEQENLMFTPRLRMIMSEPPHLRVIGGGAWGDSGRFEVVDASDDRIVLATLRARGNGLFSGTQSYRVQFGAGLALMHRFAVVIAAICLDQARDRKK